MVASTTLVLHGLRLRSPAGPDAIAARFGLDPADVGDVLDSVTMQGWAQHRNGRVSGWSLTADGRRAGERMLAAELDATGQRAVVEGIYERFLGFNGDLLSICTDWQVVSRDGIEVPNDHSDDHHDEMVLTRLADLHREFRPITDDLAASLNRFAGYRERLGLASDRVAAGDPEWIARPTIDSYHTVWFELHEDLLATLGRSRTEERLRDESARRTASAGRHT